MILYIAITYHTNRPVGSKESNVNETMTSQLNALDTSYDVLCSMKKQVVAITRPGVTGVLTSKNLPSQQDYYPDTS